MTSPDYIVFEAVGDVCNAETQTLGALHYHQVVTRKLGGIVQSLSMRDNAKTTAFEHKIVVNGDLLSYEETTTVDIYGKVFAHTDANRLRRVK